MVNLWKRYGKKLRSNILLHFGLITFRFGYGRDRQPIISVISGFSDVSLSPKTNIIYLWRHQDTSNNPRTIQIIFWNIMFGNHKKWETRNLKVLEKTGAEHAWRPVLNFLGNTESVIRDQYLQKTGNGNLVTWDQYLPKHFETKKLRNLETLKPRNFETKQPWS